MQQSSHCNIQLEEPNLKIKKLLPIILKIRIRLVEKPITMVLTFTASRSNFSACLGQLPSLRRQERARASRKRPGRSAAPRVYKLPRQFPRLVRSRALGSPRRGPLPPQPSRVLPARRAADTVRRPRRYLRASVAAASGRPAGAGPRGLARAPAGSAARAR